MEKDKQINIGCASDNNYAQHMGLMMYSLAINCKNPEKIKFFIADGGINKQNKEKIKDLSTKFKFKIEYIKPDPKFFEGLEIYESYGIGTYYRFFLLEKLKIKKMLYLDCDLIVEDDVVKLYKKDISNNIILAVKDLGISDKHKKNIGTKNYFNAGVMLIDCLKWRKNKITEKSIDFLKKRKEIIEFADQDGLNFALNNKWGELPLKWNLVTRTAIYRYIPFKKFESEKKEIFDAVKKPSIIHYANRLVKPWFFIDPSPYKTRYSKYLRTSPWKNYKYPDLTIKGLYLRIEHYFSFSLRYFSRNFR